MTAKAMAFLDTLTPRQKTQTMFALDGDERGWWSNLPAGMLPRFGIMLSELSDAQRVALHELLRASTSSQGYLKMAGIMQMDQFLNEFVASGRTDRPGIERGARWPGLPGEEPAIPPEISAGMQREAALRTQQVKELAIDHGARNTPTQFGAGNYFVSFFGTPSAAGDWGWRLGGHHMTANFTVSKGRMAFTPMFLGSQPLMQLSGLDAGWTPLPHEGDRGFELMQSLTPEQRRIALLSEDPGYEVLAGPGRRASLGRYEGLKASEMTSEQKMLLRVLVDEYVRNVDFDSASAQLAAIAEAGWDEIWFAWQGPSDDPDDIYYYRVHGPRILIEFSWESLNHIHSIVRDPANDYGEDWLGQHYAEQHPNSEALRELGFRRTEMLLEEYRKRQGSD